MSLPTRPFGKTGINVSMLALGGSLLLSWVSPTGKRLKGTDVGDASRDSADILQSTLMIGKGSFWRRKPSLECPLI
jgi:hypothetical protein